VVARSGRSTTPPNVLILRSASLWTAGTGTLALAGWLAHVWDLTSVVPGLPAMVPLTAVGLALAGTALWLVQAPDAAPARSVAGRLAAAAVAGLGAVVLAEYVSGVDLRVDRLLFAGMVRVHGAGGEFPGRPSPHTAAAFLAIGLALALLDTHTPGGRFPSSVLAPLAATIALTALLGYVYGVGYLRGLSRVTGMAVHTAFGVLVLTVGILAARPDRPVVRAFTSTGPGGTLARRIAPALLLLPFLVGLLAAGGRAGHDVALAVTITTAATFVVLTAVVAVTVHGLDAADAAGRRLVGELRRQRDFDASLLASMHEGVIVLNATARIVEVNPRFCEMIGYPREEVVGRAPPWPWWPDDEATRLAEPLTGLLERGERHGTETVVRRPDGTELTLLAHSAPLPAGDGQDPLFLSTVVDITERKLAEAERERLKVAAERERMERQHHQSQRLESLGQLAGGVAHDFNNLLAVILNYAAFVEEEVGGAADDGVPGRWTEVRGDVEQIRRAAERATALTHQLLAFGRREVVQPRLLNLNDVVADVEQLLHRTLGEHIDLRTSLAPELRPVLADPGQIEQVLINLAVNARDAMPGGGSLRIDTGNLTVDEAYAAHRVGLATGPHVRLRVSDTGTGMPANVLDHAFEPFFTTKPKGQGTGLGLATVYGIITQAEGHAEIHSELGLGTTITALLPSTDAPTEPVGRDPVGHRTRGGETVLLVEDEDAMREVTRRILARNGYRVMTASRGAEAVEIAHRIEGIQLLITDVVMPGMLGKEVAAQVQAARPAIPVLYMSGYAHPVLASQGTLDPGVILIGKPFSEPALLDKVREVLDGTG
jgi:hypothetical protein